MNIAAWLARAGRSLSDRPAVALGNGLHQDYRALAKRAATLAGGLVRSGLRRGDRVAIAAQNCPEYLECLFGAWWGGFAAVPMNAKLHGAELGWMLTNCAARFCFATPRQAQSIDAHWPDTLDHLVEIGTSEYAAFFMAEEAPLMDAAGDALAWLFYTSGTTGRPKGAMITHRNLAAMTFGYLCDVDPTSSGDSILHAAPMSHGSGLYIVPHVCRAACNIVPESGGFDPEEIFHLAEARPGTSIFAAPTMVKRLVDSPAPFNPAALRTLIWGGAPMYAQDVKRSLERFGPRLAQIFGQGESPMTGTVLAKQVIAEDEHPDWESRIGSAGIANSACEVVVADAKDTHLPAGEVGEVLIRGDCVVPGYWKDPEASAEALRNGWLHTGDIGVMDKDGFLTLKDRSKDLIISGGTNIYPREVEEVLLAHPELREVSVIGRPDEEWGEIVVAYVVGSADAGSLDRLCLNKIARFKRPKAYVFVEALPKNNYGKILKTELKAQDRALLAARRRK